MLINIEITTYNTNQDIECTIISSDEKDFCYIQIENKLDNKSMVSKVNIEELKTALRKLTVK